MAASFAQWSVMSLRHVILLLVISVPFLSAAENSSAKGQVITSSIFAIVHGVGYTNGDRVGFWEGAIFSDTSHVDAVSAAFAANEPGILYVWHDADGTQHVYSRLYGSVEFQSDPLTFTPMVVVFDLVKRPNGTMHLKVIARDYTDLTRITENCDNEVTSGDMTIIENSTTPPPRICQYRQHLGHWIINYRQSCGHGIRYNQWKFDYIKKFIRDGNWNGDHQQRNNQWPDPDFDFIISCYH